MSMVNQLSISLTCIYLDVAQFGRAPALGAGGCRFKSCHPDLTHLNLCRNQWYQWWTETGVKGSAVDVLHIIQTILRGGESMMTVNWGVVSWVYDFTIVEHPEVATPNHLKCSWLDTVHPIIRTAAGDYRHMHPIWMLPVAIERMGNNMNSHYFIWVNCYWPSNS